MSVKRKRLLFLLAAAFLVGLIAWIAWGNTALEMNAYTVTSGRLPEAFDGYRIAHVSDLHNTQMGKDNEKLLTMLRDAKPDMIAITGDLIDSYSLDVEVALRFVEEAAKIAPCYFVSGNHESRVEEYAQLKAGLEAAGVAVLENDRVELEASGQILTVLGVEDPSFQGVREDEEEYAVVDAALKALQTDSYTLLLIHRPELFECYVQNRVDLVLCGHVHGGQFRLPFIGGLFTPNQGFFPKYDAGLFAQGNTTMIISRGIGNSSFPFRIYNRPEVLLVELRREA